MLDLNVNWFGVMKEKMRKVSVLFSVGLCVSLLVISGCRSEREGESAASSAPQKKEQEEEKTLAVKSPVLKVTWIDVYANYVVTINGFPARERWVKGRAVDNTFDVPLQTGLVRGKNEVEVRLRPSLRHRSQELKISGVEFTAEVLPYRDAEEAVAVMNEAQVDSTYAQWSKRAEKEWERVLAKRSPEAAIDSIKIWAGSNPLTVSTTFDNEAGPDFSKIFEEAPRLEDTPATRERLKDYAMHLRELMARKDTAALVEEFRPAIEGRYRTGTSMSRSAFMEANRQAVVVEDVVLDFSRSDLRVQRWCGGRVWHIWREEATHSGLFQDPSGGGIGKIYVGEIDGELKVVRQG